jgi:glycosyltransferase involved in cell wall biosynthesis
MSLPRLAVVCDFTEESWPSMDLMGEQLASGLRDRHGGAFHPSLVRPPMRRLFGRLPLLSSRLGGNLDRLVNRFGLYPWRLARKKGNYDLFHVVDHSYAHLVHRLPAERTGVFCHDLDAFRCLLQPERDRRPRWFRALARHTLRGLQKAAVVFHLAQEVGREIVRHGLVDPSRLVHAAPGVAPEYTPEPTLPAPLPPGWGGAPFLLHVGSCIPRKRIDVLLSGFAVARCRRPDLRLLQVGGTWSSAQREQIDRQGLTDAVAQMRGLTREAIAALYRASSLVLLPSEAEGFGLPVIEALACGATVLASDIPVLREVGGDAAVYCPAGDVPAWAGAIDRLLTNPDSAPPRAERLAQAARYTWEAHARTIAEAYQRLLGIARRQPPRG